MLHLWNVIPLPSHLAQNTQVNDATVSIVIAVIGWLASVMSATFVAGIKWGNINTTMTAMAERLARIEGMFELRLKDKL